MKETMSDYEAVIGLETHIQLNTRSKIFCACRADSWGAGPNTNICPVCTGLPGVLPVPNQAVIDKAVRLAAAMHVDEIRPRATRSRSTTRRWHAGATSTCPCRMEARGTCASSSSTSKRMPARPCIRAGVA
jgi:hypothetical protein